MAIAGYNTIGGANDANAAGDGHINGPYTVGTGATINEFWAYLDPTAATHFRPVIYEDSAGEPGALIATLTEVTFTGSEAPAWVSVTGLSVAVAVDAVWLGIWFEGNPLRYYYDTPGGNPSRYIHPLATYVDTGDAPDPWPASTDTPVDQQVSVYVVYTAAGGTDATVDMTGVLASASAAVVAPPKPRPEAPFSEINVRL